MSGSGFVINSRLSFLTLWNIVIKELNDIKICNVWLRNVIETRILWLTVIVSIILLILLLSKFAGVCSLISSLLILTCSTSSILIWMRSDYVTLGLVSLVSSSSSSTAPLTCTRFFISSKMNCFLFFVCPCFFKRIPSNLPFSI